MVEQREFHEPRDLAHLPQKCIINCTGYGARALFSDQSIVPVRDSLRAWCRSRGELWLTTGTSSSCASRWHRAAVLAADEAQVITTLPPSRICRKPNWL